jgi:hypothetical protein
MNIQCPGCGHVQELDPDYKICLNCGGPMDESHSTIQLDPRRGRNMQGLAIVAFLLFVFIFFFWSKYIGRHGMAVSALFYIWGFYKNYLNQREAIRENGDQGKS